MVRYDTEFGFSYVIAMFVVATSTIVTMRALEFAATKDRREKETELLFVGRSYLNAIRDYYEHSPGTVKSYPNDLSALLFDTRTSTLRRPLRMLYRDPITNDDKWGIVRTEDGKVMGVFSLSTQAPIKTHDFPSELSQFEGAAHYQEWRFVYQPK